MTSPIDEEGKKAVERARNLQSHLDQVMQDEHDTEGLLEKLDRLIKELFELSQAWEPVDPEMASRVRLQEKNLHLLRGRVERLGETEADEAASIIAEIKAELANFKAH